MEDQPTTLVGSDETVPMEVANIGFMLERLGRDCDDLQFLRELTENAIQAEATEIIWDFDRPTYEIDGVYKLCCIDNGRGMTADEMRMYINNLSSSIHEQSFDGNYGVGAKVAAATRNPAGLVYQSWKEGQGAMIQLWRDPVSEQYGLRRFELPDGRWDYWIPIASEHKPDEIGEHGTKVILLGKDDDDNTITPPEGVDTPSRWVSRHLNARYFRLPEGVELKAREGWTADPETQKGNLRRGIRGQGRFLDEFAEQNGVAELDEARVHWWILEDSEKRRNASDLVNTGHVAALWDSELYEMRTGRGGVARLHQFGIIFGYQRVVLYIEPRNGDRSITSNTARTQLLLDGQPLPYADWAAEFREKMPQELRDFIDSVIAGADTGDHREAIAERLKRYKRLFRLSRYRMNPAGRVNVSEPALSRRRREDGNGTGQVPEERIQQRRKQERTGRLLAAMLADEGDPADPTRPAEQDLPKVTWVSVENETRTADFLDDRAAKYIPEVNEIQANADFRVFTDMIDYFCEEQGLERDQKFVVDVVHEWFEQALVETVIGCQALQGERRWPPDQIEAALSEQALTAAVMQRYHLANSIKRSVRSKMGSPNEKADSSVESEATTA
jgi:hypothetical protein